ncbi:MAG TPA: hypothetical protein VGZ73_24605, partial [Bryobacteraceae bacterium]|nr:hypothetical protein [Bryobacteraceae bacterium]
MWRGGLLLLRHVTPLPRRNVVYFCSAAYIGKGRKERCTPLAKSTLAVLKAWLREPQRGDGDVLFPSAKGDRLSVHGVQYLLTKHRMKGIQSLHLVEGKTGYRSPLEAHDG